MMNVKKFITLARVIESNVNINSFVVYFRESSMSYCDLAANKERAEESPDAASPTAEGGPLMDTFGRRHDYLRISLTERCNLRCQYCMPAEGVPLSPRSALPERGELLRLARVFAAAGVRKVRLTGGEPTLRKDLPDLIGGLRAIAGIESVSMTTNGLVLTRQLPALQRAGLHALNVSLDSLRPERYERMARRSGLARVLAGVDLALQLGYRPVKINTVLMKGFNDDEIRDFVEYTRDRELEVRFIEFMPFSGNRWEGGKMVAHRDALRELLRAQPAARRAPPRPRDTAEVWRVPGFAGAVGFISSMTRPFCGSCNRLRLTADGHLKVCLFGSTEVSLLEHARAGATDQQLDGLIRAALRNKRAQHAERARRTPARVAARGYCTLSHLDARGRAAMVDVGGKPVTARAAAAECSLLVGARLLRLLRDARLPKGDALSVARVAGALGAKRAAELIPLCHPLPLDCVRVHVRLPRGAPDAGGAIVLRCEARATARTGVEMEALTGAAVAALALYDMCKSVDRAMRITDLRVVHKAGGAGPDYGEAGEAGEADPAPLRALDSSPLRPAEPFVPTNLVHF